MFDIFYVSEGEAKMFGLFYGLKDKLYYYMVDKNWGVRREYGPYVETHREEHLNHRWKHWLLLLKLNWHYRILRKNNYFITQNNRKILKPYLNGAESEYKAPLPPQHFVKQLLEYDIISFDVFDTLIFRPFESPTTLFSILESENGILKFAQLRRSAEQEVRKIFAKEYGTREILIKDIYEYLHKTIAIDVEKAIKHEVETEIKYCFANPFMKKVFDILKGQNKRIIITSDMYLPSEVIEKILVKNGFKGYEELFVSGELKKSKAVGTLYDYIKDKLGKDLNYIHIGDNAHSDQKMAKKMGWEIKAYTNVNELGRPFRALNMSPLQSSAYRGIVNTYLHNGLTKYSSDYEFGFIYGGLYVLGYVNWIHEFAVANNIDKIIFLARDGNVIKRVYDERFKDISSEYLYWSRAATIRYDLERNFDDFIRRTVKYRMMNKTVVTVENILENIDAKFMLPLLKQYNLQKEDVLSSQNANSIIDLLTDNIEQLKLHYDKQKIHIKEYVEILLENVKKVVLVDVGWAGTGGHSIKHLIEDVWKLECKVDSLLAASCSDNIFLSGTNCYIFSVAKNREDCLFHLSPLYVKISNLCFEFFTQAPEPGFLGIDAYGNFQYSMPVPEAYERIKNIHQGILDFSRYYCYHLENLPYFQKISGHDAYMPFKHILKNYEYFERNFADFPCEADTGGFFDEPQTFISLMKKVM